MSMPHLGEAFDIHTGGRNVIFPHCENVLAVGRGAKGKVLVNYWVNVELVMRNGRKMSRSLSNVVSSRTALAAPGGEISEAPEGTRWCLK